MKRITKYTFIVALQCVLFPATINAENGDWTIYASYHHPTKAIKIGSQYYTLANGDLEKRNTKDNDYILSECNNLYIYDAEDNSLYSYDKSNALSDYSIYDIAYSKDTRKLVIVYNNGNIDIMNSNGGCINLPDFKNKSLQKKSINEVNVSKDKAYISTEAGIIVINIRNCYFENLYNLGESVLNVKVSNDYIYAITSNNTYIGNINDNLLDLENWKIISNKEINTVEDYALAVNENVLDTAAINTVSKVIPNSPLRNYSYKLRMYGEKLLIAGGNNYYPENYCLPTIMYYEGNNWKSFDEEVLNSSDPLNSRVYKNVTDIIQDPNDPTHHFASTKGGGLFEFINYKFVKNYSFENSPLKSVLPNNKYANLYVRLSGLEYDKEGNLWMLNMGTDTIIHILRKDGNWSDYYIDGISKYETFDNTTIDSKGYVWINSRRTTNSGSIAEMIVIDTNGTIDNQNDDRIRTISSFYNQDGKDISPVDLWRCATEDVDGAIWLGNDRGVFVCYDTDKIFNSGQYLTQIKVSRNDGTNLADYLLADVAINCIAVDGGNRKWIGTSSNGIYLVSGDGQEIIEHFTKSNSPLISDCINDIAIKGSTGEVFIATDQGLCSYMGTATDPSSSMDDSALKVYPNPVRPEYSGDVNITGLMYNSDVKIVSASGKLIYSGTSNGGMFSWNCRNASGKKVNSGIYYALCTDENGKTGACAKILIIR